MNKDIPSPLIAMVSEILKERYTHAGLDNLFLYADAPGDAPDGAKLSKCKDWLLRCNKDESVNAIAVLGKLLEDYMEREFTDFDDKQAITNDREAITKQLAKYGLSYHTGGFVRDSSSSAPSRSLEAVLRDRDMVAVDEEFNRAIRNIDTDPPASLTAACAIIEAFCKTYIDAHDHLEMPSKETIKPLWNVVSKDLGFNPEHIQDQDLLRILSGLNSIVDGLGALRTHAGSAHGRGLTRYKLKPRHVRLAVNAAHTLVTFALETWTEKERKQPS